MNIYGLIGFPLTHSFSREYFSRKFSAENIRDTIYEHFPISDLSSFPSLLQKHSGLKGLNVTIPYKQQIMPFLDRLDLSAAAVGAVNTILIRDSALIGYNTDIVGFEKSFTPLLNNEYCGALILGTGGSAAAVSWVLRKIKMPYVFISRHPAEGEALSYADITGELLLSHPVIINCTPVGMYPDVEACPDIPYDLLGSGNLLFDLIYNPEPSLFLQRGAAAGAAIKSGREMLMLQAEESWRIWNQAGANH
jgi:shikimate dehydrogenase